MKLRCLSIICLALSVSSVFADPHSTSPHPSDPALLEVELADPAIGATPEKRQQLHYLVTCALPKHVVLYAKQGTERFTFPGQMGLAPGWLKAPMTPQEERWVSACMFAMVNYFGKHVDVSLRAEPPPTPFFHPSEEEKRRFSLFEGGFFWNLFGPHPVAYVCQGIRTPADHQESVFQDRVCTMATKKKTPDGKPVTPCQFILTGPCTDPASF